MQNTPWSTKQFLGLVALFLVLEWGLVAWLTMDSRSPGEQQAREQGEYAALEKAMTVEISDTMGDYYELEQVMTVPEIETGE